MSDPRSQGNSCGLVEAVVGVARSLQKFWTSVVHGNSVGEEDRVPSEGISKESMNSMNKSGGDDEDVADNEMKRDLASVERRDSKSPCSPLVEQRWQEACTAQNDADLERPCSPPVRNTRPSIGKQSELLGSVQEVSLLEFSPSSIRPGSSGEQQVHFHSEGSPTEDNDAILSSSQDEEEVRAWFINDENIELDLKGRIESEPRVLPWTRRLLNMTRHRR